MDKQSGNRINYEFFEKPTKIPKILLAESAINSRSKRTILTQECLRRFRNTKIELDESVRNEHLNRFMVKMKNAGYSQTYRMQILNSAYRVMVGGRRKNDYKAKWAQVRNSHQQQIRQL